MSGNKMSRPADTSEPLSSIRAISAALIERLLPDERRRSAALAALNAAISGGIGLDSGGMGLPDVMRREGFSAELLSVFEHFGMRVPAYLLGFNLSEGGAQRALDCAAAATLYSLALSPELRGGAELAGESLEPPLRRALEALASGGESELLESVAGGSRNAAEAQAAVLTCLKGQLSRRLSKEPEAFEKFRGVMTALGGGGPPAPASEADVFPFVRSCVEAVNICLDLYNRTVFIRKFPDGTLKIKSVFINKQRRTGREFLFLVYQDAESTRFLLCPVVKAFPLDNTLAVGDNSAAHSMNEAESSTPRPQTTDLLARRTLQALPARTREEPPSPVPALDVQKTIEPVRPFKHAQPPAHSPPPEPASSRRRIVLDSEDPKAKTLIATSQPALPEPQRTILAPALFTRALSPPAPRLSSPDNNPLLSEISKPPATFTPAPIPPVPTDPPASTLQSDLPSTFERRSFFSKGERMAQRINGIINLMNTNLPKISATVRQFPDDLNTDPSRTRDISPAPIARVQSLDPQGQTPTFRVQPAFYQMPQMPPTQNFSYQNLAPGLNSSSNSHNATHSQPLRYLPGLTKPPPPATPVVKLPVQYLPSHTHTETRSASSEKQIHYVGLGRN